jgi:hypothetical protein
MNAEIEDELRSSEGAVIARDCKKRKRNLHVEAKSTSAHCTNDGYWLGLLARML